MTFHEDSTESAKGAAVTLRIMGILNASPESFSGNVIDASSAIAAVEQMLEAGADIVDVGGQSLRTDEAPIDTLVELQRVRAVLEPIRTEFPDLAVSVDTYRYETAEAALELGAAIINDVSGLSDPRLASMVAAVPSADLVLTYNRASPKVRLSERDLVADSVADCVEFTTAKLELIAAEGLSPSRVIFDPGVDLGKSPAQSVEVLRSMQGIRRRTGVRRVLWALSRKDFIGAVLAQRPAERLPGTLAAISSVDLRDGDILRVHEVGPVTDLLRIRSIIADGGEVPELASFLRHDR